MRKKTLKLGDYFMIPLSDGLNAYGQYALWDGEYGALSKVFDCVTRSTLGVDEISQSKLLFPPIFIGFGFKAGQWQIIGSSPVGVFQFPQFRFTFGRTPGKHDDWKLYDGEKLSYIGQLPAELRALEFLCVWSPQLLEKRIMTGRTRFDKIF